MTGIAMAALSGSAPVPALTINIALSNGVGTSINVAGSSGDLYTQLNSVIAYVVSGGVPPYTGAGLGFVFDGGTGGGTCAMIAASDGVHNTISWSLPSVGNIATFHLTGAQTDNVGTSATGRYPGAGSVILTRTS